jgi:DNA-binding transcriptional LysR family regulator
VNIRDIRAFVAFVETGSIYRAAAKLNLTQPAVSRRVQALEAALGVAVLDRSSKPPTLTAEGRLAVDLGRKILLAVDDLASRINSQGEIAGEWRLGIAPGFAETVLGAPLDAVIRAFPKIVPRITSDWSGNLLAALQEHRLDAALVLLTETETRRDGVKLRVFRSDTVAIVAARRTPTPSSPSIQELGSHPWVLNPLGCGFRAALQRVLDGLGAHLNICAEVHGYELQLSLIARGVGLGLIPMARLKASSLQREIKILSPTDFRLSITPALVSGTRQERFNSALELIASKIEEVSRRRNARLA